MTDAIHKFEELESAERWKEAYEYLPEMLRSNPEDAEAWVRALYFLHNLVLEVMGVQAVVGVDYYEACGRLLDYFRQANTKLSDNAEYLFFMGIIGHIAEYHWGEDDDTFADNMSKKAADLEPNNRLYAWGSLDLRRNKNECERKVYLAKDISAGLRKRPGFKPKGFQVDMYSHRLKYISPDLFAPITAQFVGRQYLSFL
jgi:hypothetical protein